MRRRWPVSGVGGRLWRRLWPVSGGGTGWRRVGPAHEPGPAAEAPSPYSHAADPYARALMQTHTHNHTRTTPASAHSMRIQRPIGRGTGWAAGRLPELGLGRLSFFWGGDELFLGKPVRIRLFADCVATQFASIGGVVWAGSGWLLLTLEVWLTLAVTGSDCAEPFRQYSQCLRPISPRVS